MLHRVAVYGLIAATLTSCEPALASEVKNMAPLWSVSDCPVTCVVVSNPGGWVNDFRRAALQLKAEGRRLVIDGECASACTMAADVARPNVCITKRAVMRFHKAYDYDAKSRFTGRSDPSMYYSDDIVVWVVRHGGFPGKSKEDDTFLDMPFAEARAFFQTCEEPA